MDLPPRSRSIPENRVNDYIAGGENPQPVPYSAPRECGEQAPTLKLLDPQRRSGRERSLYVSRDRQLRRCGDLPNGGRHCACPVGAGHHAKVVEALDVRDR